MNVREIGYAIPVFAALVFGTLSIASLSDLPVLSYDSFRYLSGAESILESGRYRIFNSESLHWPPGTSLLISYASITLGLDLKSASLSLNFVSYVIAGWCLYFIARLVKLNPVMSCLVVCTILINSAFLSLYDKLWSEPIFLVFLYSFIVVLILYIRTQNSIFLFISSCLLGCAIVVRYAGIGFIPILMFAPWLTVKGTVKIAKISLGSLALIVLPSVVVPVVLHVDLLGTPPGTVHLYGISYSGLINGITQMSEQLLPGKLFGYFSLLLFLITFIGMPFLCLSTCIVSGIYYRKAGSVGARKSDPQIYYLC